MHATPRITWDRRRYARSYYKRYRVITSENPSTHLPQVPDMPAMLYPLGGIRVCLLQSDVSGIGDAFAQSD